MFSEVKHATMLLGRVVVGGGGGKGSLLKKKRLLGKQRKQRNYCGKVAIPSNDLKTSVKLFAF